MLYATSTALVATMTPLGWRPGIGDPDFMGWSITAIYFVAAGLCLWAGSTERNQVWRMRMGNRPVFWFVLTALLVILGFNKQLDLQEWVAATGKEMIASEGMASHKLMIAGAFVAGLGVVGLMCSAALARYVGRSWRDYSMAFVGLAYLGTFCVARAGTWLPVLSKINHHYLDAMHLSLEMGSLIMISTSAAQALGRQKARSRVVAQNALVDMGRGTILVPAWVKPATAPADLFSETPIENGERAREAA